MDARGHIAAELGIPTVASMQQEVRARRPKKKRVAKTKTKTKSGITWEGFVDQAVWRVQQRLQGHGCTQGFIDEIRPLLPPRKYCESVEERSAMLHCGYPICGEQIPSYDLEEKTYRVDVDERVIFETTSQKMFCSRDCHKASSVLTAALPVHNILESTATTVPALLTLFPQLTLQDLHDINPRISLNQTEPKRPVGALPVGVVIASQELTPFKSGKVQAEGDVPVVSVLSEKKKEKRSVSFADEKGELERIEAELLKQKEKEEKVETSVQKTEKTPPTEVATEAKPRRKVIRRKQNVAAQPDLDLWAERDKAALLVKHIGKPQEEDPEQPSDDEEAEESEEDSMPASDDDSIDFAFTTLPVFCQVYEMLDDWATPRTAQRLQNPAVVGSGVGADTTVPEEGDDEGGLGVNAGEEADTLARQMLAAQQLEAALPAVFTLFSNTRFCRNTFSKWLSQVFATLSPSGQVVSTSKPAATVTVLLLAKCYNADFAPAAKEYFDALELHPDQIAELEEMLR